MSNKKVLVIGGGGREHAILKLLSLSPGINELFCYPGNGGTGELAITPPLGCDVTNVKALRQFVQEEGIHLTIVGPEAPLVAGIADDFDTHGLLLLGPSKAASRMEGSKVYAKEFMRRHEIPTADFEIFDSAEEAVAYIRSRDCPLVIKADGLASGKGVYVCKTPEEAMVAVVNLMMRKIHGDAGDRIVIEELLEGKECSRLDLVSYAKLVEFGTAVDYKRAYDGDEGPNTGGMGCYSPSQAVANPTLQAMIRDQIALPTVEGMMKDGNPYTGFLYTGLMLTKGGPKVLEYNIRFGDPEAQVILPRIKTDVLPLFMEAAQGSLASGKLEWEPGVRVGVVLASGNYPEKDKIRHRIDGLDSIPEDHPNITVFHAATERDDSGVYATGGRVLTVSAVGDNFPEARERAYNAMPSFQEGRYRSDIAAGL